MGTTLRMSCSPTNIKMSIQIQQRYKYHKHYKDVSALTGVAKLWEQPYACQARLRILRCLYKYSKDTNTAKS